METMLELSRHALEGVEVLFAFGTTALLGVGLMHAHQASQHGPADRAAPNASPEPLNHAA
jgi:hypothetical protein